MEGFEEDIDLETAQAQIDRSMAFVDSLVSGWMKDSKAKLPSAASRGDPEFDIDEYMRRPPRYAHPHSTGNKAIFIHCLPSD